MLIEIVLLARIFAVSSLAFGSLGHILQLYIALLILT